MDAQRPTVTLELPLPQPQAVTVDPAKTALVIVDMENDFAKPEGFAYGSARRGAAIAPIQRLLLRCREAALPVIYVQSIRYPESPEFTVFGNPPFILAGTWGSQIVEELTPRPGEPVVEKNSHDCFNNTRMEQLLAEMGIVPCEWTVMVVGLGLTNCVSCAISGFSVRSYRVVVPMDCTASRTWEEEICQYQRFMQAGYSYNVLLTESRLIEIGARSLAGVASA
jgi:nicotinamidase-related amidase